ncbi:MAG: beta-ketoacyl-[acyl-carrier-protein] synthase family protein [Candidatus Omnitrophota bacterium]|nr:beta-ketoacyl-[acyl-carrier-protein] synthase family protein [Candidatus Omnitrophota bacterium]
MGNNKVVITGIGVIAPNGIGKDEFWKALKNGISGIRPITIFDSTLFKTHQAGEVINFDPVTYLGEKGLRNLDRSTKLLCSGAKLALDDARLDTTGDNADHIGIITSTTLSVIWNIAEFNKEAEDSGPQLVNPAMFPGTTINAPSSQVSIRFNIKGFNTTISTGYTASLDGLKYAVDFLRAGRAKAILLAGVEALFFQTFVGFNKLEFLAGIKGEELSCPFDLRRNGIIVGEASAVLVLENEAYAHQRKARIYAEVKAVENFFDPFRSGRYNPKSEGLKRSMTKTLKDSRLKESEISYICAAANSVPLQDALETAAIKEVFGATAAKVPVSSIKSMVGETVSAAGALQIAASIGAMEQDFIPPTINYQKPDPACDLDYVPNKCRFQKINNVLINNFGPGGNNASCIIGKYECLQ